MPAPSSNFPIQEPLRTREECQYARNLVGYLWKEYISKGEQLVLTIDRKIEEMTKSQRGGCMLWFQDMAQHMGVTPKAARCTSSKVTNSPPCFFRIGKKPCSYWR